MDIIKHLRIKYMLTTTLIAAIFLLILFGGFVGIMGGSSQIVATTILDKALEDPNRGSTGSPDTMCMMCYTPPNDSTVFYSKQNFNFYGDETDQIVLAAVNTADGKFKYGNYKFIVRNRTLDNGYTYYAIYDITSATTRLSSIGIILSCLYICSLAFVALLSYLLSAKTLSPVEEAFTKQRDLIANASHELKTPLTIISTNLSVIQSEPSSSVEDNEKWMSSITTQIARMNGLIQNMLELSKLEQSALPKEPVNLSGAVEGACLAFEAICFEKDVKLISEISKDIMVMGDRNSLERLIVILLDNGIKYCGENGKVGCKLTLDQKRAHLEIMNTGSAISEDEAKHIFDRFYRTDGARSNPDNQSFGLGLSIAQATVTAHGGTISCRGVEDKGTVFDVYLPLMKANAK